MAILIGDYQYKGGPVLYWPPSGPSSSPSPSIPPITEPPITGLDPNELANATYGKIIPIFVGGLARIGGRVIFGPYISNGLASFGISLAFAANPTGTRALYEIALDSKVAWTLAGGFASEAFTYRFYQGTYTQAADPLEIADFGVDAVAYRPQILLFFENLPLEPFGGKIPYVAAVVGDTTDGADPTDGINLGEALERLAYSPWVNHSTSTFATSGITDVVQAMFAADDTSFLDYLRNINRVYRNLDIVQTDKLYVLDKGSSVTSDLTLTLDTILNAESGAVNFQRQAPTSIPRELELITVDPDADYTMVPSKAQRPLYPVPTTASVGKQTISLPIVIDAVTRLSLVRYAKFAEEQARKRVSLTATAYGMEIEPGDRIELSDLGDGFISETFRCIDTLHAANYTVQMTLEAILSCALPAEDPYFASVVLMMHFNGSDGSTTGSIARDYSSYNHTMNVGGGAHASTAQSVFGGSSVLLDGVNDVVNTPWIPLFKLSSANSDQFTIEARFRPTAITAAIIVGSDTGIGGLVFKLALTAAGELRYAQSNNGGSFNVDISSSGAGIVIDTWYAAAVDKDATGKIRLYLNGVMVASDTPADSAWPASPLGDYLSFGRSTLSSFPCAGYGAQWRITKGVARYASDAGYTPATAPFPNRGG